MPWLFILTTSHRKRRAELRASDACVSQSVSERSGGEAAGQKKANFKKDPGIGSNHRTNASVGPKPRRGLHLCQVSSKFPLLSFSFSLFSPSPLHYLANVSATQGANVKVKFLSDKLKLVLRYSSRTEGTVGGLFNPCNKQCDDSLWVLG